MDVIAAMQSRDALAASLSEVVKGLTWRDFELLIDLIFSASGWVKTSSVGGVQKYYDLELFNKVTGLKACVQVKTGTNLSQFREYTECRIAEGEYYDYIFYVYHTADRDLTDCDYNKNKIIVWDLNRVAKEAINAGLIDWIVEKRG